MLFLFPALMHVIMPGCGQKRSVSVGNEANVLLITIDTLRADHLGCYGYSQPTSHTIDALARKGVQFDNCVSQSSVTPVSHASILTGQNPYRHGVRTITGGRPYKLGRDHATLATLLKAAGYQTAAFVSAFPLEKSKFGLSNGFDLYEQSFYREGAEDFKQENQEIDFNRQQNPAQRRADLTTSLAIDWLRGLDQEPFFLWIHYFDPHETYLVPPMIPGVFTYSFEPPLTDIHLELYDIEIRYVNHMIQKLINELYNLSIGDDTLVILTSDHGQGLGEHDYYYHGLELYQEQIHVPLIFSGKSIPSGLNVGGLTATVDIVPTVLDVLGYPHEELPMDLDGISLRSLWESQGNIEANDRMAYSETAYPKELFGKSPVFSVIRGDEKLIHHPEEKSENALYNLARDPDESTNMLGKKPELAEELLLGLREFQHGTTFNVKQLKKGEDKESEALLKSLGYLK
jgi:arylsulfatase A-like enzyme